MRNVTLDWNADTSDIARTVRYATAWEIHDWVVSGPRGGPADGGEVSGVVSGSNQGGAQVLVPHARGPVTAADKHLGVEWASRQAIHWPMMPWRAHQTCQFCIHCMAVNSHIYFSHDGLKWMHHAHIGL